MKAACVAGLLLIFCLTAYCQKADSLEVVIRNTKADSSKSILLSQLADELVKSNPAKALESGKTGLALATNAQFSRGIFENYFSIASIYQGRAMFDSAILYFHKSMHVAREIENTRGEAEVCSALGHSFMRKSAMDSARFYLDRGIALSHKTGSYKIEAGIYNNYGNVFLEENNYSRALEYFVRSAKLYDSVSVDDQGQCLALSNIGNIEYRLGNYEEALDYAKQSMAIAIRKGYISSIGYAHKLTGRIYKQQKKYDQALNEYAEAQEVYMKLGDRRSEAELLQNVGNIYFEKLDHSSALQSYMRSLRIARTIPSKPLIANAYSAIGQAHLELKHYGQALSFLDSSRSAARAIGNQYLIIDSYSAASSVYEATGDYKKALQMHQRFAELKDSVARAENRELAEETEAKYALEKKEAQIALLEKETELRDVTLERHRAIQIGGGIALLLTLVIALLLVNRYRLSYRAKRTAEVAQVRNAIARDLHDDIGSTLSTINIISKLAMHENPNGNSIHLASIAEQSSRMMENMTDMVWSINPINDSMDRVVVKMKVFAGEILEPKNIQYEFVGEEWLEGLTLDAERRKNLFLIFKEAINNAAKYSYAKRVTILFSRYDDGLRMIISDDGHGFDTQSVKRGNGLENMASRANAIHAQLRLSAVQGEGTRIEVRVPTT